MKIGDEFDYRNAKAIIQKDNPQLLKEVYSILNNPKNKLKLEQKKGKKQRRLSEQIKEFFLKNKDWEKEFPPKSLPNMAYDLLKDKRFPIEIEIGHMRLVYADFFEYLLEYSKDFIKAGIMIVCNDPLKFGKKWQNSLESTRRKIESIKETFLVPVLVIGVDP